jgi:hypothetical protein
MHLPDLVNGSLEVACSVMLWFDVRALVRDRSVQGVSLLARFFFWGWSIWNLWWYPHLGQTLSFAGAVAVMLPQTIWVFLLIKWRQR